MFKRALISLSLILILLVMSVPAMAAGPKATIGVNVVLNTEVTDAILADLGTHGLVRDVIYEIQGVTLLVKASELDRIRALPYVAAANPDSGRAGAPIDAVAATDFATGRSTWNLDAIGVTECNVTSRQVVYNGTGVYVAVLDTGLLDSWRQYFPQERIAVEYARCFGGGGGEMGWVSEQPQKWEHDQNSHGTHVTSTIIGYSLRGTPINGVAPMVKIIPVKVLNQNGSGWSSVVARGITYIADLKDGLLAAYPLIINMSLGGDELDAMEQAAIDYAINKGVIVVASAGNEGEAGMGYPGAYEPVISVAASGWIGEWTAPAWWWSLNVNDPTNPNDFYITDFSSRQLSGQDLDVAAPGSWVVGPYQLQSGKTSYYYLGGTSMASPHVAGIVALMAQKCPDLTAPQAETILEASATDLPPGCRNVSQPDGSLSNICWAANATGHGLVDAAAALAAIP